MKRLSAAALLCLLTVSQPARADDAAGPAHDLSNDARFGATWKQSQILRPKPSPDTTAVEYSVGNVHYRTPRNYIVTMDDFTGGPQVLVAFKVTFPGFKPLSDTTKDCLTLAPAYRPQGCVPIQFNIISRTPVSDDEVYSNAQKGTLSPIPKNGPYGFQMYEVGTDSPRTEIYEKHTPDHALVIDCLIIDRLHENIICTNSSRLPNQNGINYILNGGRYFFNGAQLKYAEEIDSGLRSLIESFTVTAEKQ